ncbi:MAG: hypothetical protein Q7T55_02020 [Solirubrobacteraceae bacterium]|nr:hypothetical protein [Solirubrobacteraceae bacterium]
MTSRLRSAPHALVAVAATSLVVIPTASAARNAIGTHTVVDHKGANVRQPRKDGSPSGLYLGHLKKGDRFTVSKHDGSFCFGKAAGKVDKTGWVLCGALSTTATH